MSQVEVSMSKKDTQGHTSVCPLDCADTCSLQIATERGQVVAVRGNDDNPFTRGKLCAKVTQTLADQVHGPRRVETPMRRVASGTSRQAFEAITWEQALDTIYERFHEIESRWGAQAIAPLSYGGPMGLLAGGSMDKRFFNRLGASQVDSSPLCAGTSNAAWDAVFGDAGGIDFEELAHSKLILIWGNNVTTCNLHLTTTIRAAQKSGSKVVVIDPKRTRIARDADLHIDLMPGTDVVLAYAVARLLSERNALDEQFIAAHVEGAEAFLAEAAKYDQQTAASICGVDEAAIAQFADLLATQRPAGMSIGVGPERNQNGSAGIRAAFSLLALTGNIGPLGAGPCDVSRFFPMQRDVLARPDLMPAGLREINVLDLPRMVLNGGDQTPIKALFVYNHNPIAVHPEQSRMREALLSDEVFVVAHDVSMTDSLLCADIILPGVTHLEYGDLYTAYGHRYLQRSRPVLAPIGQGLSNTELFRRLAARFGFSEPCFSDSDQDLFEQAFNPEHKKAKELTNDGAVDMTEFAEPAMLRGAGFSTASGKIELYSADLEKRCGEGVPKYKPVKRTAPFILVTPASERRVNSTFGGEENNQNDILCEMNPQDALEKGLVDGSQVVLFNEQAEVDLPLKLTDSVRRGTIFVPKGAWIRDQENPFTVNALLPGHQEPLIGGACYYDCCVDIRPA
ncbi:MAG: molybdopterin oxidoreductase family protein [Congregibacter sp.]